MATQKVTVELPLAIFKQLARIASAKSATTRSVGSPKYCQQLTILVVNWFKKDKNQNLFCQNYCFLSTLLDFRITLFVIVELHQALSL
jgi:hypothetical protein